MPARGKLTDELEEEILDLVRQGNFHSVACKAVGIADRTLRTWIDKGKSGDPKHKRYAEFADKLEEAEAVAETIHVISITDAAADDWKASAWYLARKHPERWGDKEKPVVPEGKTRFDLVVTAKERAQNDP